MAVYSVLKSDKDILNILKDYDAKRIIIFLCGGCTNESLAYSCKEPIFVSTNNTSIQESIISGDVIPYASVTAGSKIQMFLQAQGYEVDTFLVPLGDNILCIKNDLSPVFCNSISNRYDLILAMCCPAGIAGIREEFNDVPIIPLMKPIGQLFYKYVDSENTRKMVYDKSVIIKYT